MTPRDKAIVRDLERFKCMTRDDIIDLHFNNVGTPVNTCNRVLKRLRRDGRVTCTTDRRMYIYFPVPGIKKDSAKMGHFLAIVDFYRQLTAIEPPKVFDVEPKLGGKGLPEPDAFCIWKGAPFFVEIQRSVYTPRVMAEKMNRYEAYYHSDEWQRLGWQPEKKVFPYIWIVGSTQYAIEPKPFKVIQCSPSELLNKK